MSAPERPPVRLELDDEQAWCGERRLALTPRAFAVLRHLVAHAQRLVTKDDMLAAVWGDAAVTDAALASCIRDLRRALGDSPAAPRYIETVHRRGFRFIGPVAGPRAETAAPRPALDDAPPAEEGPALVGRDAELARLNAAMARAAGGERRLVFVTGEPGIGKSALVDAALREVSRRGGARVARGQCVEHYGAGEPYLPLLEAVGRLGRDPGGAAMVAALRTHAPTWLAELPGLLGDEEMDAARRRAEGSTRERMLRELVDALDAVAADAPLVLALEDLHWSDSATIDVLAMLARRRERARLLVIATYRPAEVGAADHPLRVAQRELELHGCAEEVPLPFLDRAGVGALLAERFADHAFPPDLADALHRTTEGNPLFALSAIDDLVARGAVAHVDGRWRLTVEPDAIALGASTTLAQVVERQVERLAPEEQALLAVACVAGAEFSAAVGRAGGLAADEAERRCEALARRGQLVRAAGVAEWPDGTLAGRYAFIHARYQDVLYERLSAGQRVALHHRVAEQLERGHRDRAADIAGELALHFERGHDYARAAHYRALAGEHALRQHGYREAAAHASHGLALLGPLSASPEHARQELALQVVLGAALTATRGYGAPEVEVTYERARTLCAVVADRGQVFPALLGLGRCYVVRGEFGTARAIAGDLLAMAEPVADPARRVAAHNAAGVAAFYAGDFTAALAHLDRAMALYDPDVHAPHRSALFGLGQDPGVSCTTHAAWALWITGAPDRAAAKTAEAIALARSLDHPFSVSYACHFGAGLHQWRGDRAAARALEDEAAAIDAEHGFGLFQTAGAIQRGWLAAGTGRADEGLAQMRASLARHRAIGAHVLVPAFASLLVDVLRRLGRPGEALATVEEAFAVIRDQDRHYWAAELHRMRGALLIEAEPAAAAEAEASLRRALEIAGAQRAASLELRAATDLCRLWASRGRAPEGRSLLSGVLARFTEGFDTADVAGARDALDARPPD